MGAGPSLTFDGPLLIFVKLVIRLSIVMRHIHLLLCFRPCALASRILDLWQEVTHDLLA